MIPVSALPEMVAAEAPSAPTATRSHPLCNPSVLPLFLLSSIPPVACSSSAAFAGNAVESMLLGQCPV